MQCERLNRMIKSWYVHVREETMAPARMVSFMEQHVESCSICEQDPDVKQEIAKITELVLPESKIPKAVRQQNSKLKSAEEENVKVDDENTSDNTTGDDVDDDDEDDLRVETNSHIEHGDI